MGQIIEKENVRALMIYENKGDLSTELVGFWSDKFKQVTLNF